VTLKRVIARMDVKGEHLVKGLQLEGLRKIGDPLEFAEKYYLDGADEIVIVDVVASLYSRANLYNIISYITSNLRIPVTVVGGIKNIDDAKKVFSSGADKVGINSAATRNVQFLQELANLYGAQAVVSSIEAKHLQEKNDWYLFTESGRNNSGISLPAWLSKLQELDIGEVLITSVDRDGMKTGPDLKLIKKARDMVPNPFLYSGGISTLEHLEAAMLCDIDGVLLGSSLHYGIMNIQNAKHHLAGLGYPIRETG